MADLEVDPDGLVLFAGRLERICDALHRFEGRGEWNPRTRSGPVFPALPQAMHMAEATVPTGVVHFDGPTAPLLGTRAQETAVLGGAGQVVFPDGLPADRLKPGVQRVSR